MVVVVVVVVIRPILALGILRSKVDCKKTFDISGGVLCVSLWIHCRYGVADLGD